MPLHGYSTDRRPPTNKDHLYAHPYSFVLCAFQVIGGSGAVLSTLSNMSLSQSLDRLPESLLAAVGALLIVGGVLVIRGLLDDSPDLMVGWRTERTGLVLSATGWTSYAVTVAAAFPGSVLSWLLAFLIAAAHMIRFRATQLEERHSRERAERERAARQHP